MNKYSLQEHLQEELTPFTSTFKATSYDEEKDEYLCSDADRLSDIFSVLAEPFEVFRKMDAEDLRDE